MADWWKFRGPVVEHWLQMVGNASRWLTAPSVTDWVYNRKHAARLLGKLAAGELEGLQRVSPVEGFVSTPVDGIGAAFTGTGRLCSLLFPHTAFTHQVPYYVDEANGGVNERLEGSFGGIVNGPGHGEPTWLWTDAFDHAIDYERDSGLVSLAYLGDDLRVDETAYVYPGSNTLVRDFEIANVGDDAFDGAFVYHTRANVTDEDQTFAVWNSHRNRLTSDGGLRWTDLDGPYALGVWGQRAGGEPATATIEKNGRSSETEGRYLDGRLRFPCSLDPGETATFSVFVGDGRDAVPRDPPGTEGGATTGGERRAAAREWWRTWLDDVDTDAGAGFDDVYVRSLVLLGSSFDPETGSVAAAPNLQPMYYPSWIRDDAFVAVALARAGKPTIAKTILGEFCPGVQEADGSFRQCYNSRGEFAGVVGVENDQQPLYVWAVSEVYDVTGDEAFVERAWPAVSGALEYTVDAIGPDGLLVPSPDIAEYPDHVRQSLWTNTFAYRGLLDGAELADDVGVECAESVDGGVGGDGAICPSATGGVEGDAARYREAARTVGDAVERHFFERVDGNGEYLAVRDANGGVEELHLYDAAAIYPTGWAVEYGHVDRLQTDLLDLATDGRNPWIPGLLMAATAFMETGLTPEAERLLEATARETTTAGHLKETPSVDGGHYFASPLAWSHAAFVLAVTSAKRRR